MSEFEHLATKPTRESAVQAAREYTTFIVERLNAAFRTAEIAVSARITDGVVTDQGGNFSIAMDGLTSDNMERVQSIVDEVLHDAKKFVPSGNALN